jgi:hypothetical protein
MAKSGACRQEAGAPLALLMQRVKARAAGRILGAPGSQASRTYDAIRPAQPKQVALRSARVPLAATHKKENTSPLWRGTSKNSFDVM